MASAVVLGITCAAGTSQQTAWPPAAGTGSCTGQTCLALSGAYILYSDVRLAANTAGGQSGGRHGAKELLQLHAQAQQGAVAVQTIAG